MKYLEFFWSDILAASGCILVQFQYERHSTGWLRLLFHLLFVCFRVGIYYAWFARETRQLFLFVCQLPALPGAVVCYTYSYRLYLRQKTKNYSSTVVQNKSTTKQNKKKTKQKTKLSSQQYSSEAKVAEPHSDHHAPGGEHSGSLLAQPL